MQGGAGAPLTYAVVEASTAEKGEAIYLDLYGTGFRAGQKVSFTPSGQGCGTELSGDVIGVSATSARAQMSLADDSCLDVRKRYVVQLKDDSGKLLGEVPLDLEYVARAKVLDALTSALEPFPAQQDAHSGQKSVQKQVEQRRRVMTEALKAAESERQLYLAGHPEVQGEGPDGYGGGYDGGYGGGVQPNRYCVPYSSTESTYISVRRSVVDPKEASDSYGHRIGRRFLAFEVTVENTNPNLQYMLHDVSVDLSRMHNLPPGTYHWAFSSQDLIMLRGVPEKGEDYDPRNLALHIARGTGAVAGGVTGLAAQGIQDVYGGVVAAYNGPLLSAYLDILPDHTATQLNRLSDSAFTANTVVAKQSAKTFAIFVPEDLLMNNKEQRQYWRQPATLFENPGLDFREADVCVDGTFISELPALTLAAAAFDKPETVIAGTDVAITVKGSNLAAGDTVVDAFGGSFVVSAAAADGSSAQATVTIPATWDLTVTPVVSLESKKTGFRTPPMGLALTPQLDSLEYLRLGAGDAEVKVTGARMQMGGDTVLRWASGEAAVTVDAGGRTGTAEIGLGSGWDATRGQHFTLQSRGSGLVSQAASLVLLPPTLTGLSMGSGASTVKVTGTHLVAEDTQLVVDKSKPLQVVEIVTTDGVAGVASFSGLPSGLQSMHLHSKRMQSGGDSNSVELTVPAAQ